MQASGRFQGIAAIVEPTSRIRGIALVAMASCYNGDAPRLRVRARAFETVHNLPVGIIDHDGNQRSTHFEATASRAGGYLLFDAAPAYDDADQEEWVRNLVSNHGRKNVSLQFSVERALPQIGGDHHFEVLKIRPLGLTLREEVDCQGAHAWFESDGSVIDYLLEPDARDALLTYYEVVTELNAGQTIRGPNIDAVHPNGGHYNRAWQRHLDRQQEERDLEAQDRLEAANDDHGPRFGTHVKHGRLTSAADLDGDPPVEATRVAGGRLVPRSNGDDEPMADLFLANQNVLLATLRFNRDGLEGMVERCLHLIAAMDADDDADDRQLGPVEIPSTDWDPPQHQDDDELGDAGDDQ